MKNEKLRAKSFEWTRNLRALLYFSLLTFNFSLAPFVSAQDDSEFAPPPLKVVSKDERTRLDAQTDIKSRTKLALDLMQTRLTAAEMLTTGEDFDGVFRELGVFQGLMDSGVDYLTKLDTGNGKVLDNFKRLEIAFRGFGPRLEAIRRDMPPRYEDYIVKLMKYLREARIKAIDPQFADTVVPNPKSNN
ncbi:MAG: hypothetical protein ABIO36_04110 [Pyrinomonadaceae bacterium]